MAYDAVRNDDVRSIFLNNVYFLSLPSHNVSHGAWTLWLWGGRCKLAAL